MKIYFVILTIFTFISCSHTDYKMNFTNSSTLAFNLLKTSVDAAINAHPSINTANYVVDLSKGFNLDTFGRDSFITSKEKILPVTHEDSVIYYDTNGKSRVLRSMIIKFDTIVQIDQKTVKVIARKIKSSESIVTVSLILERKTNGYVCIKSE